MSYWTWDLCGKPGLHLSNPVVSYFTKETAPRELVLCEASELDDKPDLRTYSKFGVLSNLSKIFMTFYLDLGLTPDTNYIQLYKANSTGPVTAVTLCSSFVAILISSKLFSISTFCLVTAN